jgi:death on curing protein
MIARRVPAEPRWITEHMLLAIHSQQVERYGGLHGVLDTNVILSALARPQHRWTYDDTADWADLAAAYLVGFARTQGFNDGNKRTALACALVFLAINGLRFEPSAEALYAITMGVATNRTAEPAVAAFFREHLDPGDPPTAAPTHTA